MSRNLDTSLANALSNARISPVILAGLTFRSGTMYVWSGVGDFVWNGNTYKGIGQLGKISAITEGTGVQAEGMEIALSGIGLSPLPLDVPSVPTDTNPLPVTPTVDEFTTTAEPASATSSDSPGYNVATASGNSCSVTQIGGGPFGGQGIATLTNFELPPLPLDAVITRAYLTGTYSASPDASGESTPVSAPGYFSLLLSEPTAEQIRAQVVNVEYRDSLVPPGGSIFYGPLNPPVTIGFDNVRVIVYYTSSTNAASMVQAAMSDFQAGAPANIYFGLMSNGTLIGNPYLVFRGQIDQPTIKMSTRSATIILSLENKLSNLLRPTARRYTAADQHLKFPDDSGFNWVEILNDIALRWGS